MNYTISTNYMKNVFNDFFKSQGIVNGQHTQSFIDSIEEKIAQKAAVETGRSTTVAVDAKDMTMEQYRQYIYDRISHIPIHPSQSGWNWNIEITDSGFEAMKNDPEYEEYVLSSIRTNFSFRDPFHSQNYSILHFGASEEESYGRGWGLGNPAMQKSEDSFWDRREARRKKRNEQLEEFLDKKAFARHVQQEKMFVKMAAVKEDDGKEKAYGKREAAQILAAFSAKDLFDIADESSTGN